MHDNNKHESNNQDWEILSDNEIVEYLQDVVNIEKELECIECEEWPEDIRKKVEEFEQLKIRGNDSITFIYFNFLK